MQDGPWLGGRCYQDRDPEDEAQKEVWEGASLA